MYTENASVEVVRVVWSVVTFKEAIVAKEEHA